MKVWQAIGCAIGALVLFVGLIIGMVLWATGGITETADNFFAAARQGDYAEAHSLTSQALQRQSSPEELQQFLVDNGLDKVTETSWSSRSIENGQGKLEGTLTTESGGSIPVTIEMVQENDQWKITFIEPTKVGLQTSGGGMAAAGAAQGSTG